MTRHYSTTLHRRPSARGSVSALALCTLAVTAPAAAQAQEVIVLDDVIVSATAVPTEASRIGASVEVATEADLQGGNGALLTDVLGAAPGISVTRSGPAGTNTDLRVRGAQERYLAVTVDGIRVNDPSATSGQFANFGALGTGSLSRVEVLKGAQSALYGGAAVAGAVNIFTLPLDVEREGVTQSAEFFFGSYETVGSSYTYANRQGRLTLAFGLSHLQSEGFSAADEDTGNTEADSMRETRLSFGARYAATDTLTLGVNGFMENGRAEFDEFGPTDGTPGDDINRREAFGLRLFAELDTGPWAHEFALSYFDVERRATQGGGFAFDSRFAATRLRFEYAGTSQITDTARLTLGADVQEEEARYANLTSGVESVTTAGAFAEVLFTPNASTDIITTLRYDDHSEFGGEPTGRAAFAWRPTAGLTLRGAASTGYRPPSIDELFGNYPGNFPFFGNPALQPETSESFEIGADYRFAAWGRISATLFQTGIENFIQFSSCPLNASFSGCAQGTNSTLVNVPGKTTFKGVEIDGEMDLSETVTLTGAYTYIDARESSGARVIRVPEHEIGLGLKADLTDRISGAIDLRRAIGRPAEGFPAVAPGDYTVVNLTLNYAFSDAAEAYLRIENLTDEAYQTVPGYGTSDRAAVFGLRASF